MTVILIQTRSKRGWSRTLLLQSEQDYQMPCSRFEETGRKSAQDILAAYSSLPVIARFGAVGTSANARFPQSPYTVPEHACHRFETGRFNHCADRYPNFTGQVNDGRSGNRASPCAVVFRIPCRTAQPLFQLRPAPPSRDVAHRDGHRLLLATSTTRRLPRVTPV